MAESLLPELERPWREPTQKRSRETVARVMAATRELIEEGGLAGLKMTDISTRSGVPVGAIYRFFPDKHAVVGRIFVDQIEDGLRDVYALFNPGGSLPSPSAVTTSAIESRFRAWSADPVMAEIWSIVQADRTLRYFSETSSKIAANIMSEALAPFLRPGVSPERLWRACFVINDLFDQAIHTSLELPKADSRLFMAEYAKMVSNHLQGLLVSA